MVPYTGMSSGGILKASRLRWYCFLTSRSASAAPLRSYLLMATKSAKSSMSIFSSWLAAPNSGVITYSDTSTSGTIAASPWPMPEVSTTIRSKPATLHAAIVPLVDVSLYVMTPEFGAASQLEKIDMLDFADFVAINKYDRKGAADALRDVRKQYQRNREAFKTPPEDMPVYGTIASRFNDDGVTALYQALLPRLAEHGLKTRPGKLPRVEDRVSSSNAVIVPPARSRYLAEIADGVRAYHAFTREQARLACERQQLTATKLMLLADSCAAPSTPPLKKGADLPQASGGISAETLDRLIHDRDAKLDPRA